MQLINRNWVLIMFVLVISAFMHSCMVPGSKESYLEKFERFVDRVEKHHEDFNKKDWKWADTTFDKFSNDWYNEYKNELTSDEELVVIALKLKYQRCKQPDIIQRIYKDLIKNDAAEIKNEIDSYIKDDLDEDVDQLIDGMKEIGDSAVKVIEDVIEEIDNRF